MNAKELMARQARIMNQRMSAQPKHTASTPAARSTKALIERQKAVMDARMHGSAKQPSEPDVKMEELMKEYQAFIANLRAQSAAAEAEANMAAAVEVSSDEEPVAVPEVEPAVEAVAAEEPAEAKKPRRRTKIDSE